MALHYGILRGRVDVFRREDDLQSPHLQIRVVDGDGAAWRVAVNVLSGDHSLVVLHRVDPLMGHPIAGGLPAVAAGFTPLAPAARSDATSLDYLRAPLFDWPTGIAVPPNGPGATDDLQDMLVTYLEQLRSQGGELYAFGAKFPAPGQPPNPRPIDHELGTLQGVHDVHMNQGNPAGPFFKDNGVFQDGGLVLAFPQRIACILLRFRSQWLPTDDASGARLPVARDVPPGAGAPGEPGPEPTPITHPDVYIERALVNPAGGDVGREVVVLGNSSTSAVDLSGWSIADRNGNAHTIGAAVLAAGESRSILLTGESAQLGNKGGTIVLRGPSGAQVHAVSYSKADAALEDRYIRFNT